jgi:hypothetical protein
VSRRVMPVKGERCRVRGTRAVFELLGSGRRDVVETLRDGGPTKRDGAGNRFLDLSTVGGLVVDIFGNSNYFPSHEAYKCVDADGSLRGVKISLVVGKKCRLFGVSVFPSLPTTRPRLFISQSS